MEGPGKEPDSMPLRETPYYRFNSLRKKEILIDVTTSVSPGIPPNKVVREKLILLGLEAISAIVKARLSPDFDWSEGRGKWTAAASKYSSVAGIALFAVFAFLFLLAA